MKKLIARGLTLISSIACLPTLSLNAQTFLATDIPPIQRNKSGAGKIHNGFQSGEIECDVMAGEFQINWSASQIENLQPDYSLLWNGDDIIGTHKVTFASQTFAVRFFPTAACVVSKDAILIGGVNRAGETVIEQWSLTWPSPMPCVVVDSAGISSVSPVLVGRSGVESVYKGAQVGMHLVRSLSVLRKASGAPQQVLAQFDDSGDVYAIALDGSSYVLIASSIILSGTLGKIPGLVGSDQTSMMFGDHIEEGYTYLLGRSLAGTLPSNPAPNYPYYVMLKDANRDGVLDGSQEITFDEFFRQGWYDFGKYIDPWTY